MTPTLIGHTTIPYSEVIILEGATEVARLYSDAQGDYRVTTKDLGHDGVHHFTATVQEPSATAATAGTHPLTVEVDTHIDPSAIDITTAATWTT